ncbi:serine hydrolase [candidate division KSB1 bacterium]|nr:serine hydrolase [candidate division KSB1 bacterium]
MKKIIRNKSPKIILITTILFLNSTLYFSCSKNKDHILKKRLVGIWQANYADSMGVHIRYLTFQYNQNNGFLITLDEPDEDWYDVPVSFHLKDSTIYMELWWGIEKLYGKLDNAEFIITGKREVNGKDEQFTYRKLDAKTYLSFKEPRFNNSDDYQKSYKYFPPKDEKDGIQVGNLKSTTIDTLKIYSLMNQIRNTSIPNIHSVLIIKNGKLILEEYFYGYNQKRLHRVHSVTKSFTSALIGIAIDNGYIKNMDSEIYTFFTDYGGLSWIKNKYPISIQHALSMTSGLLWRPITSDEKPDIIAMYESDDCLEYILDKKADFPPGKHFQYNDGNSILLGKVLEKVSNISINDFAMKYLFSPLGITTYSWDIHKDGTTRTEGGLRLTSRDMAKFGVLYLNKGLWNGQQIISEKWIKVSISRQTPIGQREYGNHWWIYKFVINHRVIKSFCAIGHGEQFIFVIPEFDMVVIFTAGNYFQTEHRPLEIMVNYILPSYIKEEQSTLSVNNKEIISKIVGEYAINSNEHLIIQHENHTLYAIDPAQNKIELYPITPMQYISKNPPREVVFIENQHGDISHIEIYSNGIKTEEFIKL